MSRHAKSFASRTWMRAGMFVALAAPLAAQDGGGTAKKFLASLDVNRDGSIARAEWKGSGSAFMALDVDLDGYLMLAELSHAGTPIKRESPASDPAAIDRAQVAIGALPDPPELLVSRCTACHDTMRIEDARKNAGGWADTVARMRMKKEAKISERDSRQIVEFLSALRATVAKRVVGYGSDDPLRDWAFVVGSGDLHLFDRDNNGKLDGQELCKLVFDRADVDRSGSLSRGELALLPLAADRHAHFAKLDRSSDGALSPKELGVPSALLELFDGNQDSMLSREELPRSRPFGGPYPMILAADAKSALELLDRDHDDKVSYKELDRFAGTLARFDENKDSQLDAKELETAVTAARAEGPYAAFDDFITRFDLDGDGEVVRLEFPGSDALFARLDADGDGSITSKEAGPGWRRTDFTPEAGRWRQ